MDIEQITPPQAEQLMQQGHRYLDVRTEMEFANGHPAGAVNIPVAIPDARTGQMALNPEFVDIVAANFTREEGIVVGCQAGARSQRAAEMLAAAGFQKVINMQGGWGGGIDPRNGSFIPGWMESGLPTSHAVAAGSSYTELRNKRR